ncbi:hypothetical protein LCGC14_2672580 [marine sediment metagenome]|uniref:Uncharacterized protein n=1 Tax=marine sediment metagenome TaxID=412755 RepID=A0A0F9BYP0_9ZZZZ
MNRIKRVNTTSECGKCPECKSTEYSRHEQNWFEDCCTVECECNECGFKFKEHFILIEQEWKK